MNAHEKTWQKPCSRNQPKNSAAGCLLIRAAPFTDPPIQTRTEGARNSGVFCCHNMPQLWADSLGVIPANFLSIVSFYGVIHGDLPDAIQFVILDFGFAESYGGVYLPNGK